MNIVSFEPSEMSLSLSGSKNPIFVIWKLRTCWDVDRAFSLSLKMLTSEIDLQRGKAFISLEPIT